MEEVLVPKKKVWPGSDPSTAATPSRSTARNSEHRIYYRPLKESRFLGPWRVLWNICSWYTLKRKRRVWHGCLKARRWITRSVLLSFTYAALPAMLSIALGALPKQLPSPRDSLNWMTCAMQNVKHEAVLTTSDKYERLTDAALAIFDGVSLQNPTYTDYLTIYDGLLGTI